MQPVPELKLQLTKEQKFFEVGTLQALCDNASREELIELAKFYYRQSCVFKNNWLNLVPTFCPPTTNSTESM